MAKKKEKLPLEDPSLPDQVDDVLETLEDGTGEEDFDAELDNLEYEGKQDRIKKEYEDQKQVVAEKQEVMDALLIKMDALKKEYDAASFERDVEDRKLSGMEGAKASNTHNIQAYLKGQDKLRQARAQERLGLQKLIGRDMGKVQAPIDAAMARKTGRGGQRPAMPFKG